MCFFSPASLIENFLLRFREKFRLQADSVTFGTSDAPGAIKSPSARHHPSTDLRKAF